MLQTSKVFISNLTGKLDGVRAISTNTLTNEFCQQMHRVKDDNIICTICYSWYFLQGFRKKVATAIQRNNDLLSKKTLSGSNIPTISDRMFRFSAHGELINLTHLDNLVKIAEKNSDCIFSLWTKRKGFIIKYFGAGKRTKPDNLILIYSNPRIDTILSSVPNKWFDKTFNNVSPDNHVSLQNCTGQKCRECMVCYTHNNISTIVEATKPRIKRGTTHNAK